MNNQTLSQATKQRSLSARRLWRYGPLLLWLVFISFASTSGFSAGNTSQIIRPLLLWLFPNTQRSSAGNDPFPDAKAGALHRVCDAGVSGQASLYYFVQRIHSATLVSSWDCCWLSFTRCSTSFIRVSCRRGPASIYDSAIDIAGGLTVLLIFKLYDSRKTREADADKRMQRRLQDAFPRSVLYAIISLAGSSVRTYATPRAVLIEVAAM